MIIYSLCNSCLQSFQLIVETSDVHLIKEISDDAGELCDCPRLCGGKINLVGEPTISYMVTDKTSRDPVTLTGKQLYQAVMGLGLPDELPKDIDSIDSILRANKVIKTNIEEVNGKLFLHELTLDNNVTLHLASGLKGAQILKITRNSKNV